MRRVFHFHTLLRQLFDSIHRRRFKINGNFFLVSNMLHITYVSESQWIEAVQDHFSVLFYEKVYVQQDFCNLMMVIYFLKNLPRSLKTLTKVNFIMY